MGTYMLGTGEYRKAMATRMRNLKRRVDVGLELVSSRMVSRAKRNAPRNTGKLSKSISKRKTKSGYTVSAGYLGNQNFAVAPFTNQQFPINTKDVFNKYFMEGQTIMYGFPALSAGGNPVKWTSKVDPWWTNAVVNTQREFGKKMVEQVRMALRSA